MWNWARKRTSNSILEKGLFQHAKKGGGQRSAIQNLEGRKCIARFAT